MTVMSCDICPYTGHCARYLARAQSPWSSQPVLSVDTHLCIKQTATKKFLWWLITYEETAREGSGSDARAFDAELAINVINYRNLVAAGCKLGCKKDKSHSYM